MAQDAIINRWDINGDVYDIQDAGRGRPLGVATLDENGVVPETQLPPTDLSNVSGILPVANGGTGQTSQLDINKAIIGALESTSADVTDGTEFISSNATDNGFAETNDGGPNKPYKRQFIKVWNYIKSKISSVLGLTETSYNGNSATATMLSSVSIVNIRIGSAQAKISLNQLMTWLITTKEYIPSGIDCYKVLGVPWDYNGNDILQLSANGINYELQLAGCIIEFLGNATNYNTGRFRLRIHASPTYAFTLTSGYTVFPTSRIAEYTCNGSEYSPTWKVVGTDEKYANSYWGLTDPSGADNVWLRTTSQGIIPYQGGGAGSGHCSIGTSTWYFSNVFTDYVNGYVPILKQDSYNGGSKSGNARNYIRFTNGLKIQWGIVYKGSNLAHGAGWETTVTMSLAFASYNYSLTFGSVNNNQSSFPSGEEIYAIRNSNLQSFKVKFWNRNGGDTSIQPSIAWIAIGW